ncbi:MAG: lasso RiPP family leader peptide-containing protein [Candidatus Binataceae bacterium]
MSKERLSRMDEVSTAVPKAEYHTPRLIEYGHIARLTAGNTGSATDKGTMANVHGMG